MNNRIHQNSEAAHGNGSEARQGVQMLVYTTRKGEKGLPIRHCVMICPPGQEALMDAFERMEGETKPFILF